MTTPWDRGLGLAAGWTGPAGAADGGGAQRGLACQPSWAGSVSATRAFSAVLGGGAVSFQGRLMFSGFSAGSVSASGALLTAIGAALTFFTAILAANRVRAQPCFAANLCS